MEDSYELLLDLIERAKCCEQAERALAELQSRVKVFQAQQILDRREVYGNIDAHSERMRKVLAQMLAKELAAGPMVEFTVTPRENGPPGTVFNLRVTLVAPAEVAGANVSPFEVRAEPPLLRVR